MGNLAVDRVTCTHVMRALLLSLSLTPWVLNGIRWIYFPSGWQTSNMDLFSELTPCGEYIYKVYMYCTFGVDRLLGDCAGCRFQENAIQHTRPGARTGYDHWAVRPPGFRVRIAFPWLGQRAQSPRGYSEPKGILARS